MDKRAYRILITGAHGQLGSEIKELAGAYPFEIDYTDSDTLDITNAGAINQYLKAKPAGWIVNCAAYTAVDKAESEPEAAHQVNSLAPGLLAQAAKANGSKLVHVSTDYVFDGKNHKPYKETDSTNPQSAYGRSKLEGEKKVVDENPEAMIIRTSWLYSNYGNNFVKSMIRLGKERDELGIVADQTGTPTYAADLARAILDTISLCNKSPERYQPGIYHYANEGTASWYDFAMEIFELEQINVQANAIETVDYPTPATRPYFSVLSKKKIKESYGVDVPHWKKALKICLGKA
jgi:dTDP-4-dehydrorhamnose reductase